MKEEAIANREAPAFNAGSDLIKCYFRELNSILRQKIENSDLINGVDRVLRSLADCIDLAESSLGKQNTRFEPEKSSPRFTRTGDIFSGHDRVDSKIADCIKLAEDTLRSGSSHKQEQWDSSSDSNCEEIVPELLNLEHDQEYINYVEELDGIGSFDDLDDWTDDVDLFMEGLCNPDKIDELWQQSKAKRLRKISLSNSKAYRTSKESNPQPVLQGNALPEGDQAKSITSGEPDSPYSPEELKNLQKYREYLNDITIRAEGGWPFPDTLPYDEILLRYTLGLSSYSGSGSELEEIPTENQESPKRTHTFTQMNSDTNCQSRARQTPEKNHPQLARQGNPLSGDSQPDDGISVDDYMNRWNNRVETGTTFPNSPTPNTEASRPFLGSESDSLPFPNPRQLDFNSDKADYFSQDSTLNLVIRSTPQGWTVRWEELGHNRQSAGIPDPQINELPFQIGAPLALSEDEDPEVVEDLCHKILIVARVVAAL